ncbi:MAG: MogA/MoaB family molybdenum cofactor biosynthesis protein [Gemmatimonadaceae bacterium]
MAAPLRVAVLTVSDAGVRGERADVSGERCVDWVARRGGVLAARAIVPDRSPDIVRQLLAWCDGGAVDLVLTTGGTGLAERDVTPEATRAVLEREAPGIAERLRAVGAASTPRSVLSRGIAGVRGRVLVVNLPGSPGGVSESLAALDPIVDHACEIASGRVTAHPGERDQPPAGAAS